MSTAIACRTLPDIQADLAAARARLEELENEQRRLRADRHAGIVADFDAGLEREAIAAKWAVEYGYVAAVLYRARRTERTRRAQGLNDSQRVDYQRLLRAGVRSRIARVIALRSS